MRVQFGEYELDTERRTLQRGGRRIPMQSKAFDLLAYLIERRERVVASDELLDALWPGLHVTPAALSTAVQKARQAVGDDGEHQTVIHTEHGKGFRFVAEVTDLSEPATARPGSAVATRTPIIAELKRRNVFRVAAAYAIVAWLLVEVASVVLPTFEAPTWVMKAFTFLVILGFPVALVLAWAFELTPEGIKREAEVDRAESITHLTGRKLDFAIIGLLLVALIFVVVDQYVMEAEQEQAEVTAESVAREKSIAVLPFTNISPDPEDAYFADGIHDEILVQISKIRDLKVISRTSVMRYRGEDRQSSPEIAAVLGVANLLEGSVRLAGNRVRITAQLIEAESDAHLWTETYDRELTAANIFSIQSEIAKTVADALRATLSPEEQDRLTTVPTENLAAYQAYLLGRHRLAKSTTVTTEEAIAYFQRAIELDPQLALAYVGLAQSYLAQIKGSGLPPGEMQARAQTAADKALELDDGLAEVHVALGQVKWATSDFEGAEAAFQHALALNPNSVMAYLAYSDLLGFDLARYEEALALARKAVELDPLSLEAVQRLGEDLQFLGRFDEALAWYERLLEIDPGYDWGYTQIGLHHSEVSGRLDKAAVWWAKSLALDPSNQFNLAFLSWLFLELGDPDRAEYWLNRSIELSPEGILPTYTMQAIAVYRGNEAAALEHGRKAFAVLPHQAPVLTFLRTTEIRAGRYIEARALYEELFPELLSDRDPEVDLRNYRAAIDLALILSSTGEQERADLLLNRSLQQIQRRPRLGRRGYGIADVQVYAMQGEKQKALSALRQAIDEGWRTLWWYFLKHDPNLESLHDEPEYRAMVVEIEADMADQLARVREMERNGELESIPGLSATKQ